MRPVHGAKFGRACSVGAKSQRSVKHGAEVKFQETVEVFYVVRESDSLLPPRRTSRRSMEDQSRRNLAQFAQNHQKIVSQMTSCLEGLSALVSGVSGAPRSIAA